MVAVPRAKSGSQFLLTGVIAYVCDISKPELQHVRSVVMLGPLEVQPQTTAEDVSIALLGG